MTALRFCAEFLGFLALMACAVIYPTLAHLLMN